jgi:hypothetical protein
MTGGDWVFMTGQQYDDLGALANSLPYTNNAYTSHIQITVPEGGLEQDFKGLCYGDINASNIGLKEDWIAEPILIDLSGKNLLSAQNYPNPFTNHTTISYMLPDESSVTIELFDMNGTKAASILNEVTQPAGYNRIEFSDELPAGVYVCYLRVTTPENIVFVQSFKWIVLTR